MKATLFDRISPASVANQAAASPSGIPTEGGTTSASRHAACCRVNIGRCFHAVGSSFRGADASWGTGAAAIRESALSASGDSGSPMPPTKVQNPAMIAIGFGTPIITAQIAPPIAVPTPVINAVPPSQPITVQIVTAQSTRDLRRVTSFLTARSLTPSPIPPARRRRIDLRRRQGLASRLLSELGEDRSQGADARREG
jgi:hypothetical protein